MAQVQGAWSSCLEVPIRSAEIEVPRALELATSLGLFAYDAYVLETARAERSPLLTLDRGLARAAATVGVGLRELWLWL